MMKDRDVEVFLGDVWYVESCIQLYGCSVRICGLPIVGGYFDDRFKGKVWMCDDWW